MATNKHTSEWTDTQGRVLHQRPDSGYSYYKYINLLTIKYSDYWTVVSVLQAADCTDPSKCYCIPMGDCFNIDMEFDFNNCWLAIDKPLLSNASLILELEAFNQAMLSSNVTRYKVHVTCLDIL